jgi:hypothetical protein
MEVNLVYRPIGMAGNGRRVTCQRAPEIREIGVYVVNRLRADKAAVKWVMRPSEENSQRTGKRFNVVRHVAKPPPDVGRYCAFTAEVRER